MAMQFLMDKALMEKDCAVVVSVEYGGQRYVNYLRWDNESKT